MTLTPAQAVILQAMQAAPQQPLVFCYGFHPSAFIEGRGPLPFKAVGSLRSAGLIAVAQDNVPHWTEYTLTPAGAEALAAWEAGR